MTKKTTKAPASKKLAAARPQLNMRVHPNVIVCIEGLQKNKKLGKLLEDAKLNTSYPSIIGYALQKLAASLK
jgi:hypothetical protein